MSTETVIVPLERLKQLEALEADLPNIIAKAKKDRDAERLQLLHAKQKENPEPNKKRVLKNYHKNKDEINAKRREKYKLAKTQAVQPNP
jgi:Zn-dependent metalloprotease